MAVHVAVAVLHVRRRATWALQLSLADLGEHIQIHRTGTAVPLTGRAADSDSHRDTAIAT
jgi:hypothetical protein